MKERRRSSSTLVYYVRLQLLKSKQTLGSFREPSTDKWAFTPGSYPACSGPHKERGGVTNHIGAELACFFFWGGGGGGGPYNTCSLPGMPTDSLVGGPFGKGCYGNASLLNIPSACSYASHIFSLSDAQLPQIFPTFCWLIIKGIRLNAVIPMRKLYCEEDDNFFLHTHTHTHTQVEWHHASQSSQIQRHFHLKAKDECVSSW